MIPNSREGNECARDDGSVVTGLSACVRHDGDDHHPDVDEDGNDPEPCGCSRASIKRIGILEGGLFVTHGSVGVSNERVES